MDDPAGLALAVLLVRSEGRSTIIRTMLMGLTVLSHWNALNVSSFVAAV